MEKLNQIIEKIAKEIFYEEHRGADKQEKFIFNNATLMELVSYYEMKESNGKSWYEQYGDKESISQSVRQGLGESFIREFLWPKLKDHYIEKAVKSLEDKVSEVYKITIEKI